MKINFFNVKKKLAVNIDEEDCRKVIYVRKTSKGNQERYAVRAQDSDGANLTKFVSKETFEKLSCPVAK